MIRRTYLRWVVNVQIFQSTHRVSDATLWLIECPSSEPISIHAPRERCDGVRLVEYLRHDGFQSTHRMSDATDYTKGTDIDAPISIHAPDERCEANKKLNDFYLFPISIL